MSTTHARRIAAAEVATAQCHPLSTGRPRLREAARTDYAAARSPFADAELEPLLSVGPFVLGDGAASLRCRPTPEDDDSDAVVPEAWRPYDSDSESSGAAPTRVLVA